MTDASTGAVRVDKRIMGLDLGGADDQVVKPTVAGGFLAPVAALADCCPLMWLLLAVVVALLLSRGRR